MKPPKMLYERKKESSVWTAVFAVLCVFLAALICLDIYIAKNCIIVNIDGDSMMQTVKDGDALYADKYASAQRGDVVVIDVTEYPDKYPTKDGETQKLIIKRLIAMEGDCVKCENGAVYVKKADGEYQRLGEEYAYGVTPDFEEVAVQEGEIFFLGDNRTVSKDSRMVGCLDYDDIVAVVPSWAIAIKGVSTVWETFRRTLVFG